jgi:transposase
MAHDIETRRRAIAYWAEGHTKAEVAAKFGVSESALHAWRTQLNEIGTLVSKRQRRTWRKIDQTQLVKYVHDHPNAYLKEIAAELGCSIAAVSKALARLEIERKDGRK